MKTRHNVGIMTDNMVPNEEEMKVGQSTDSVSVFGLINWGARERFRTKSQLLFPQYGWTAGLSVGVRAFNSAE